MTANPNLAADQKSLGKQGAFIDDNAAMRSQAFPRLRSTAKTSPDDITSPNC